MSTLIQGRRRRMGPSARRTALVARDWLESHQDYRVSDRSPGLPIARPTRGWVATTSRSTSWGYLGMYVLRRGGNTSRRGRRVHDRAARAFADRNRPRFCRLCADSLVSFASHARRGVREWTFPAPKFWRVAWSSTAFRRSPLLSVIYERPLAVARGSGWTAQKNAAQSALYVLSRTRSRAPTSQFLRQAEVRRRAAAR